MESTQNPNNCHSYHSSRHWSCRSISQSDPNNKKLHWNLSGESAWRTDWTFLEGLKPSSEQISSKAPYCLILLLKSVEHQELWRFLQDSCPSKWSHICSQLFLLWQWTLREVLRVSWKNDISTMHSMEYAMYGMQISVTYHSYHSYHLRRTTKTLNCERQLGDHHLVRCIRLAKLADIQTFNSSRSGISFCTIFYDSDFCPLWSLWVYSVFPFVWLSFSTHKLTRSLKMGLRPKVECCIDV